VLSRWFYYQTADPEDQDRIAVQVAAMPCLDRIPLAELPTHFFLSATTDVSIVIGIHPQAWKLHPKSWWRQDIKAAAEWILEGETLLVNPACLTYLVWSRSEALMPASVPRVLTARDAEAEAACMWGWIRHVCGQTVSVQKAGGLKYDFHQWLREQDLSRLPAPRSLPRPSSSL